MTLPYPMAWIWCYVMEMFAKLRRSKKMPYLTLAALRSLNTEGYLDGTKARNELGWKPMISIEEGAKRYVQWRQAQQQK